ncbi:MAG: NAD(P)/FAD-dependent oxidoreductase [Casimicrobiaceae bacterium]
MARIAIVGAGPAGASAGWHLARQGHQVDLVDRSAFPRPKTCGDWIPLNALAELDRIGLGRSEIERLASERAAITTTIIASPGGRVSEVPGRESAYCIPRLVFDAMLWRHAVDAGCRPLLRTVRDLAPMLTEFDHVVDARGAHAGTPNGVALRAYWTVPRGSLAAGEAAAVQIHADARFRRGYGWMFPVFADSGAVRINVGVGLWAEDSVPGANVADYYDRFVMQNPVLSRWRPAATIGRPVGCHVGMGTGANAVSDGGILRIGDAANLADPLTGDGIANALASGRLVAESIAGASDRLDAAARWQAAHDATFVPEFRRARLLQRALVRTSAKNLTAALLAAAPSLRARVHAAFFGETPYARLTQPWL